MATLKAGTASQEIDDYIDGLAPFAKDICNTLRSIKKCAAGEKLNDKYK